MANLFDSAWIKGWWRYGGTVELKSTRELLSFPPIFSCVSLITGEIAKLRIATRQLQDSGIWTEVASPKGVVLRKPNHYQTQRQFIAAWMVSRLMYGNTYVLKERDNRGVVNQMHVLDPCLVTPLVAESGDVYYRLGNDNLAQVRGVDVVAPASEIAHDRIRPLWHPLVGVSPLHAAALAGTQGIAIQTNSSTFFSNMSRPSGILSTPSAISNEQARNIKEVWETGYGGANSGRTAVLGDDMKYMPLSVPADQSQLAEQFEQAALMVAMAFQVPPYKLGLKVNLTFSNAAQLDQDYYKQCLQGHMEDIESTLDNALELSSDMRIEFDTAGLFRMDPLARAEVNAKRVGAGILKPNEARADDDLPPVDGGDTPYLQVQNYSLAALARRDAVSAAPGGAPHDTAEKEAQMEWNALADQLRASRPEVRVNE